MSTVVSTQLEKVVFADLSHFDESTQTFIIPRYSKPTYKLGACYLVKVAPDIVNNPNSVIATNWNRGTTPTTPIIKAYVSKVAGKMLYVDTIGFDLATNTELLNTWSGWLSIDDLTQLATLQ